MASKKKTKRRSLPPLFSGKSFDVLVRFRTKETGKDIEKHISGVLDKIAARLRKGSTAFKHARVTVNNKSRVILNKIKFLKRSWKRKGDDVIIATAREMRDALNVPGKPVTYPVKWDSPKQRTAFFASNGFGAGIPYERTGRTKWTVISGFSTGEVDLFAPHPAGAVFGMPPDFWQSRIHRGRWVELKKVLKTYLSKLPSKIKRAFQTVYRGKT